MGECPRERVDGGAVGTQPVSYPPPSRHIPPRNGNQDAAGRRVSYPPSSHIPPTSRHVPPTSRRIPSPITSCPAHITSYPIAHHVMSRCTSRRIPSPIQSYPAPITSCPAHITSYPIAHHVVSRPHHVVSHRPSHHVPPTSRRIPSPTRHSRVGGNPAAYVQGASAAPVRKETEPIRLIDCSKGGRLLQSYQAPTDSTQEDFRQAEREWFSATARSKKRSPRAASSSTPWEMDAFNLRAWTCG